MTTEIELKRGLQGVYIDKTLSSFIDGAEGKLLYRGYSIHDLAEKSTFEETVYLLLYGKLPNQGELDDFDALLRANRSIPPEVIEIIRLVKNAHPMDVLRTAVSALAAFDCHEELQANVARYAANREILLERLPGIGFEKLAPVDGAFYVYADVGWITNDAGAFCAEMLRATGVAATPGDDFDPVDGARHLRFSFAGATQDIAEATDRLARWLG